MRKFLLLAVLSYAIACNSPESNVSGSDSTLNSPPGFTTDTSGGSRPDTSHVTDTLGTGTGRTGPENQR
ncbi:MAG TPA: hypothetical protein VF622_13420 [Segetibacter sp.]|jgi:hypothetical protein